MTDGLREFVSGAGPITACIYGLSLLMWTLILDHYRCLRELHSANHVPATDPERTQRIHSPPVMRRLRAQQVADVAVAARRHLPLIRTLIQALPLLGLLGTVSGLVHCFEGIAQLGENNRRAIAGGIAEALVATLSGLLTALSGLYFSVDLERRAARLRVDAERVSPCAQCDAVTPNKTSRRYTSTLCR